MKRRFVILCLLLLALTSAHLATVYIKSLKTGFILQIECSDPDDYGMLVFDTWDIEIDISETSPESVEVTSFTITSNLIEVATCHITVIEGEGIVEGVEDDSFTIVPWETKEVRVRYYTTPGDYDVTFRIEAETPHMSLSTTLSINLSVDLGNDNEKTEVT